MIGRRRRRQLYVAALALGILVLVGCSGRTTVPSEYNSANNTIKLNALGSCDTSCTAFMRFRVVGTSTWTNTPSFNVPNKVTDAPWSRTITVSPGTRYEYQACGREQSQSQAVCVGPAGTGTTEKFTAGRLQVSTDRPLEVRDRSARVGGWVSYPETAFPGPYQWAEYGKTASYGTTSTALPYPITANKLEEFYDVIGPFEEGGTYHYRWCASVEPRGEGPAVCGQDRTVTTTVGKYVDCGDTLTKSMQLDSELFCDGDGVVIGAPNITLDLNGHGMIGDPGQLACGPGLGNGPDYGVDNTGGYDGVTIKNGYVQQFEEGVELSNAADNIVQDVRVTSGESNMCQGIYAEGSDRVLLKGNTVAGASVRNIGVQSTQGSVVEGNVAASGHHVGIAVWDSLAPACARTWFRPMPTLGSSSSALPTTRSSGTPLTITTTTASCWPSDPTTTSSH